MVDEQRCPAATYTEAWLPEQLRGAETLSSKFERYDGTPLKTDAVFVLCDPGADSEAQPELRRHAAIVILDMLYMDTYDAATIHHR